MPDSSDELRELRAAINDLSARVAALEGRASAAPLPVAATARPLPNAGLGLTVINRIGALTLAIGVIFFFKYAADNEWIGPAARVFIGIIAGLALLAASHWLDRWNESTFAQGIAGCGYAAIYISLFAAYRFYHLIGLAAAAFVLFLISAAPVYIAVRNRQPNISLAGFAGALITPALLGLHWHGFDLAYVFVAIASFVAAAQLIRRDSRVASYSYVVGHLCTVLLLLNEASHRFGVKSSSRTLESVLLALYGLAMLVLGFARSSTLSRALGGFFLGVVIAKLYLYDVWQLNYGYRITAFVVLGMLLLVGSYLYGQSRSRPSV